MTSTSPSAVIRLRSGAFDAWAELQGLTSEVAQAERIGVSSTNLNRIKRGVIAPGEQFIAAVLAGTGRKFEDMFEIAEAP
jgi:hypothetical protein